MTTSHCGKYGAVSPTASSGLSGFWPSNRSSLSTRPAAATTVQVSASSSSFAMTVANGVPSRDQSTVAAARCGCDERRILGRATATSLPEQPPAACAGLPCPCPDGDEIYAELNRALVTQGDDARHVRCFLARGSARTRASCDGRSRPLARWLRRFRRDEALDLRRPFASLRGGARTGERRLRARGSRECLAERAALRLPQARRVDWKKPCFSFFRRRSTSF